MNLFTKNESASTARAGISVIEVMSAMVVALIGVFGVLVLIPFSVQQAQSGLARDEAATVGRNALEQLEIEGFFFVDGYSNTRIGIESQLGVMVPYNLLNDSPRVLVVDPLFVAERRAQNLGPYVGFGPSQDPTQNFSGFERFTLADNLNNEMSVAMARHLCRTTDDLQFGAALDDLGPPEQIFDQVDGTSVRRQSDGRTSWNTVLVPVGASMSQPGLKFRMNVLVHRDRDLLDGVQYENRQFNLVGGGTGNFTIRIPETRIASDKQAQRGFTDVRRDDWVMLRNIQAGGNSGYQSQQQQVGFYRVAGVDSTGRVLTLDGPDWQPGIVNEICHLVGIRDGKRSGQVISVYERTMRWERKSNWN